MTAVAITPSPGENVGSDLFGSGYTLLIFAQLTAFAIYSRRIVTDDSFVSTVYVTEGHLLAISTAMVFSSVTAILISL